MSKIITFTNITDYILLTFTLYFDFSYTNGHLCVLLRGSVRGINFECVCGPLCKYWPNTRAITDQTRAAALRSVSFIVIGQDFFIVPNNSRVMVSPTKVSPSNNWQLPSIKHWSTMMLQLLAYLWFILNTNKVILPSPETINKCICMLFAFGNDDNKPCENEYLLLYN